MGKQSNLIPPLPFLRPLFGYLTASQYGLGSMGIGMALNLQKHLAAKGLPPLHYSNRTLSRGDVLKEAGAVPEATLEDVVAKSNIVFTMISNDEVLQDLISKAVASHDSAKLSLEGKIWVDTSTVHPETCAKCATRLAEKGAVFVASPVFGASPMAASGKLIFSMAGPAATIERLQPYILDVMGREIINMGEDVQKSSLLKISGYVYYTGFVHCALYVSIGLFSELTNNPDNRNIFVVGFQELIAEAQVFAEKTGLGTAQMETFIGSMFGPVLESYSKRMTTGAYAPPLDTKPGFGVDLSIKDARHAINIATEHGTTLPTISKALERMTAAKTYAGDSLDSSSLYGTARLEAGLPFWSENSRQGN